MSSDVLRLAPVSTAGLHKLHKSLAKSTVHLKGEGRGERGREGGREGGGGGRKINSQKYLR